MSHEFVDGGYKVTYMVIVDEPGFDAYKGRVKIGDATYHTSKSLETIKQEAEDYRPDLFEQGIITTPEIEQAGGKRVNDWSNTADLPVKVMFCALNIREITINVDDEEFTKIDDFRDHNVHTVLIRSKVFKSFVRKDKKQGEWFNVTLENAIEAFKATVQNRGAFDAVIHTRDEYRLRHEQLDAIKVALKEFRNGTIERPKKVLYNASMRFGKTITTYSLIKEMHNKDKEFKKILIITHRPVVGDGWKDDFHKVFGFDGPWQFAAKNKNFGVSFNELDQNKPYVDFASIQDLRGSFNLENTDEDVHNMFEKNEEIFNNEWDLIVIDEGHEGTDTELAKKMMKALNAPYQLYLSGTPFNIMADFKENERYNWTYLDERKTAEEWENKLAQLDEWNNSPDGTESPFSPQELETLNFGNPYSNLPKLEIRAIDIAKSIENPDIKRILQKGSKVEYNFRQFFKTVTDESQLIEGHFKKLYAPFVNIEMVAELLQKILENDQYRPEHERNLFPFGDAHSKQLFAHTLWILPNIDAAIALRELLYQIAPEFHVINATGDNDSGDALADVKKAIKKHARTITLSVGKLTTGTTIPEWNGVLLFTNMKSPMLYMQTIFRVKSSDTLYNGTVKKVGYVFDFAPNRALEMLAQVAINYAQTNKEHNDVMTDIEKYQAVEDLSNYFSANVYDGSRFRTLDTNLIMQSINSASITNSVDRGFETNDLFKSNTTYKINTQDRQRFENLQENLKKSGYEKANKVIINESTLTEEQHKQLEKKTNNANKEKLSEAEKARKADLDNDRKIRTLLKGVAVRIPLLIMAHNFDDKAITLENFSDKDIVDDESWNEFMPKGFTREDWQYITKFFNKAVFEGACSEISNRVKAMDTMLPLDRVFYMANLFTTFKNPDKETVLTPWRVVNMQLANTVGGLRWTDDNGDWYCNDGSVHSFTDIDESDGSLVPEPRFVNQDVGDLWDNEKHTFYDINSKTALYLLFAAATLFKKRLDKLSDSLGYVPGLVEQNNLWNEIVDSQIFVNTRVPYSEKIAQRVLLGYNKNIDVHASVVDIIKFRIFLKDIRFVDSVSLRERKLNNAEIYKLIGWVLLGVKDEFMSVESRCKVMDKSIAEALELANADEEKFTAVLSNPPYQINSIGNSYQVYADFYMMGRIVSKKLSMIFPIGWQTSTGAGSGSAHHKTIRSDKKLFSVNNFYEDYKKSPLIVFPDASTGGVNILYADETKNDSDTVKFYEYGNLIDDDKDMTIVKYWSDRTQSIFDKLENFLNDLNIDPVFQKVSTRKPFGIPSYILDKEREENKYVVDKYEDKEIVQFLAGLGNNKYEIFYLDKNAPFIKTKNLDKWKLAWTRTGPGSNYRSNKILEPLQAVTETFLCIYFDSEKHAKGFKSYFESLFYRFALSEAAPSWVAYKSAHRFCPDLSTITNPRTGLVGWDSDWTDEDLKILFKDVLTDEDWAYIEKTALESDGGRK